MKNSFIGSVKRTEFDGIPVLYDLAMSISGFFGPWSLMDRVGDIPKGRVLDLGGGTGSRTAKLLGPGHRAVVADLSGPMLKRAYKLRGFPAVLARGQALPFPDNSFDAVLMIDMLHHAGDGPGCVADAARVLAPGGCLYILDFQAINFAGKIVLAFEKLMGFDSTFHTADDYANVLAEAGVEAEINMLRSYEYLITGRKPPDPDR